MPDWGDLANKGLGKLEDVWDTATKVVGKGVDTAAHGLGGALDYVGAHDWADAVEDWGDDIASDLGVSVREQELGQSEQANEVVHGKPSAIRESAKHMTDFRAAFDRVGQGMKALDSRHWRGAAADAFREKFAMHPADWFHASDACETAGGALNRYADTVEWAQRQAQEAIELYKQGMKASKDAEAVYRAKFDAYEAAAKAGSASGACPAPGADPGRATRARARDILNEARRQRDEAAAMAERALKAALEHAPAEPPPMHRALGTFLDCQGAQAVELTHVVGGAVKGTAGILNFARGLNPQDPYNLTHPAEHQQHINMTLAGLVSTAAHPERVPGALIDSFKDDPSEGIGRLIPELIGTKGLGGARTGVRVAEEAVENAARKGAKREAAKVEEEAAAQGENSLKGEDGLVDGDSGVPSGAAGDRPHLMRQDDDFSAEYNSRGQRKAHLNADGDLVPANPDGQAGIVDHVVGRDPAKSDSPYTSLSSDGADAKDFGGGKIKIDLPRLEQDIAAGHVQGVVVHSPSEVQAAIQASADEIAGHPVDLTVPPGSSRPAIEEAATELGLSKTKTKRIVQRMVDMMNTRRDEEWLIKGIVPSDYITGP
ncbi:putative T7SS-secreted protein [Streptomyces goshikiensis]